MKKINTAESIKEEYKRLGFDDNAPIIAKHLELAFDHDSFLKVHEIVGKLSDADSDAMSMLWSAILAARAEVYRNPRLSCNTDIDAFDKAFKNAERAIFEASKAIDKLADAILDPAIQFDEANFAADNSD